MTRQLHLRSDSPRQSGASRFAGSWRAPMGGLGGAACTLREVIAGADQRGAMCWFADRDHRADGFVVAESKSSKSSNAIGSDYRPVDAGSRSAESNHRGDTP